MRENLSKAALGLALAVLFISPVLALDSPEQALEIHHAWYDGDHGTLTVELLNLGEVPVVAWTVAAFEVSEEGKACKVQSVTKDGYLWVQDEDREVGRGPIRPGEKRVMELGIREDDDRELELRVIAVVFPDGASLGDRQELEGIRDGRLAAHKARAQWLGQFEALLEVERSPAALRSRLLDLRDQLDAAELTEAESSFTREGHTLRIDRLLHYLDEGHEDIHLAVRLIVNNLRKEYQAGLVPVRVGPVAEKQP